MPWMQSTECPQPAEQQGQPWGPAKAWDHPCSFFHHFLRALTLAMHSCHSSTGPVPDQGSLGLRGRCSLELSGQGALWKMLLSTPPSTPTPKISLAAWLEHPELACVPLFEGGGDFLMHHILFFPNTKNRPLFYRMTALAFEIPIPCAPSVPKLVFWVGWPRAKPLMAAEMVAVFSHSWVWKQLQFVLLQPTVLDEFLIPANELGTFRGWAEMALWMKPLLGLSCLGISLDLSPISPG